MLLYQHITKERKRLGKIHFQKGVSFLLTAMLLTGLLSLGNPFSLQAMTAYAAAPYVVVLDAGHDDEHTRGVNRVSGIVEDQYNLKIAKSLKKQLEAEGITVYLTRTDGSCPGGKGSSNEACLAARCAYAASVNCDLYVSLHLNASGGNTGTARKANGSIVYISGYSAYKDSLSDLAGRIVTNLKKDCGISIRRSYGMAMQSRLNPGCNDGGSADYYKVIRESTYNGFPSILIEHCFMDNLKDAAILKKQGAEALAKADARAIINWFNSGKSLKKTSAPSSDNSKSGYVNYKQLNLRGYNSADASLIVKLSQNDPVYIYDEIGGWYQVIACHDNFYYEGWVNTQYITLDKKTRHPELLAKTGAKPAVTDTADTDDADEPNSGQISAGYVNYGWLNLRKAANTKSAIVVKLDNKDPLIIHSKQNGWYQVTAVHGGKSYSGYVAAKYVAESDEQTATGYVNYDYLNVRSGPGTKEKQIGRLDAKQQVVILEKLGKWYKISYQTDQGWSIGYVSAKYITEI